MTDTEIETLSTLFILLLSTLVIGGTLGWWLFLRLFKWFDDYMQDRHWQKKGYQKMKGEDGKTWYVGYMD
jgi:hypothetical protein